MQAISTRILTRKIPDDPVTINLDWLAFMAYCPIAEPVKENYVQWLNDEIVLEYLERGTPVFKHSYNIIYNGQMSGNLHTHSRSDKTLGQGVVKIEIQNWLLYSNEWIEFYDMLMTCLSARFKNLSRVDIAIDGANWLPQFLNAYVKQPPKNRKVIHKGKVRPNAREWDKMTSSFNSFTWGKSSTPKMITVYCKTNELERSNKEYIRTMWKQAGLNTAKPVWRCELRMKSEAIKCIKDLSIVKLIDKHYLLRVFCTHSNNFMSFVQLGKDKNITRAKEIDIFHFRKLKISSLEKTARAKVDGRFKAKLALHVATKDILCGWVEEEQIESDISYLKSLLDRYNLYTYFNRKFSEWSNLYKEAGKDIEELTAKQNLFTPLLN